MLPLFSVSTRTRAVLLFAKQYTTHLPHLIESEIKVEGHLHHRHLFVELDVDQMGLTAIYAPQNSSIKEQNVEWHT